MFILGNFFIALAGVLDWVMNIFMWLVFIRAIISWVNPDPFNPIVQFLYAATEPVLAPIRQIFPPMAMDFSPLVVFLLIIFLKPFLVSSLWELGMRFKM